MRQSGRATMLTAGPRRSACRVRRLTLKGELRRAPGLLHVRRPGDGPGHRLTGRHRRPRRFAGVTRNRTLVSQVGLFRAGVTPVAREKPRDRLHVRVARSVPCDGQRAPWLDARPRDANDSRSGVDLAIPEGARWSVRSGARCSREMGEGDRRDDRAHRPPPGRSRLRFCETVAGVSLDRSATAPGPLLRLRRTPAL